jgi:hypothetical protein
MATQMPNPRHAPLVDPRTGMLAPAWVRPFEELFGAQAAPGGVTNVTNVTNTTTVVQVDEQAPLVVPAAEAMAGVEALLQALLQQPVAVTLPPVADDQAPPLPAAVVLEEREDGVVSALVARVIELEREIEALKQGLQA